MLQSLVTAASMRRSYHHHQASTPQPPSPQSSTSSSPSSSSLSPHDMECHEHLSLPPSHGDLAFLAPAYCEKARQLMLNEFARLYRSNSLDYTKVIRQIKTHKMRDDAMESCEPEATKAIMTEEMQASLALIGLRDGDLSPTSQIEAIKQVQQLHSQRVQRAKTEMEAVVLNSFMHDGASAFSYSTNVMGHSTTCCSQRYQELFMRQDGGRELEEFNAKQLGAPLLWGKAIWPQDHPAFFASVVQASLGHTGESSIIVKCVTADGETVLGVARFRCFYTNEGYCQAFSITPIPSTPLQRAFSFSTQECVQTPTPPLTHKTMTTSAAAAAAVQHPHYPSAPSAFHRPYERM